ncbi:MAG: TIGR04086 family membrane protein [Firmicutes bacterium HGW-Firmicutes-1]|jgi:putative membrane protein (TIGR04086 family)|nr:MAG: TIGR04086 family membrane protein [Firmicutes bacterium HGW-Firmicutes-1]
MRDTIKSHGLHLKKITYNMTKIILFMYILTGLLLFLLAFLMFKMDLGDNQINLGIIIIMVACTFIGGILAGKAFKEKRFIYGALIGLLYFLILVIISSFMQKNIKLANDAITMFFICVGSGTLGGMLG